MPFWLRPKAKAECLEKLCHSAKYVPEHVLIDTETVYVETEVDDRQENGYFNGGRIPGGGFSGGGGCGIGGCNSFLDYVQQNTK